MNDKSFANKVNQDLDRTRKDLVTLGNDGITMLSRKYEQLSGDITEKVADSVKTFNKSFGKSLRQYNTKVQHVADQMPGDFGKKAAGYPWVTITLSLVVGMLLGAFLKPGRQLVG